MHFKMLSAICFTLDQSKILSSGNGLIGYHEQKLLLSIFSFPTTFFLRAVQT